MNFSFSEDQTAIRDLARQIFTDRSTDEFMLGFDRAGKTCDETLWQTLAEQGLLAISLPESCGGSDLGFTELCLVLEEQGRRVSPLPLFASLVLGALPISEFGSDEQKTRYLAPLAEGKLKLSAAIAEIGMSAAAAGQVRGERDSDKWVLNGSLDFVPDGPVADAILVPVNSEHGQTIVILDSSTTGLRVHSQKTSLGENAATLHLDNVEVTASAVLGEVGQGEEIVDWLMQRAETALCAMLVGVTEEALKRTAEFTCERKQFGVPIGSFQAVAMQAADAFIDVEAIRSTYWLALYKLDNDLDARAEVCCAKWFAAQAGHRIAYRTQHLHGGMGVDLEYPIHRFFLWAKHLGAMLGGSGVQLSRLGSLLASDETIGTAALRV